MPIRQLSFEGIPASGQVRALSIMQPWASLIIGYGKSIENRTWATQHRGPLLIHAGKKIDRAGYDLAWRLGVDVPAPDDLPRGGIIGQVELVDCVRDAVSPWAFPDCWHWRLESPRALPFEPCPGQMGLFWVPD